MTTCAIHQPNFFPWAGYFDKIRRADIFIFLDEVDYPKKGSGTRCDRVKLFNNGQPAWYGLPLKKQSGRQLVKDMCFVEKNYHLNKLMRSLEYNYKQLPSYDAVMAIVEPLLAYESDNLAEYNMNAIQQLSRYLGLSTQFIRQSEVTHSQKSTELLIELLQQVHADTYLCGNGSAGYQQDHLFGEKGINLVYQNYQPTNDQLFTIPKEAESLSIINHLFYNFLNG